MKMRDQYGCEWNIEICDGIKWGHGFDDEGKRCVRRVDENELWVDCWSKPRCVRHLTPVVT